MSPSAVILVEGISDRIAVETLAARLGRDLESEGVRVLAIGGAQAIRRALAQHERNGVRVAGGLCDAGEERICAAALGRAGLGSDLTRADMEALGFFVCVRDLEDELIRAHGPEAVERIVEARGDLRPLRTLQKQVAWQGRPLGDQLRRFMGSGGSRKVSYARFLVEELDLDRVPRPLEGVLASV